MSDLRAGGASPSWGCVQAAPVAKSARGRIQLPWGRRKARSRSGPAGPPHSRRPRAAPRQATRPFASQQDILFSGRSSSDYPASLNKKNCAIASCKRFLFLQMHNFHLGDLFRIMIYLYQPTTCCALFF